ncbi:AraC family transcriptional regulator [Sinosporangium siamense]|uniref:AraC family transcriptional regulator n=1 Tax=Sinosporangium siamense TaxID=1367973 RepID=A0A919RKY8_9ACTN|nr:AraC family transcriptional regulator [Sinosporangium siamense]GII95112.1 AraC family transcriptional regulator [Sinosporangium siamense]
MSVVYEHLEPLYPLGWRHFRLEPPWLTPRSHVHPEFELVCIVRGAGTRLIGDSIEQFEPGDLVLIGPHLAHTYASIPEGGPIEAIVVQFTRDVLGEGFFDQPVFADVAALLDASADGLRFVEVPPALATLDDLTPAEKTVALLDILVALSRGPYVRLATGQSASGMAVARRIESIVAYVHEHYRSQITLRDIADVVQMNPSAASRLFSRSTGFTLTRFITVVRLNAACRLLHDTDLPIATIAAKCGFVNLSNFNRRFREVKQTTPKAHRALLYAGQGGAPTHEHLPDGKWVTDFFTR